MASYHWHRYSVAESFERLLKGETAWVALGDFLDDWRRSEREDRLILVEQPLKGASSSEEQRWAALFAAAVEQICTEEKLSVPFWVRESQYYLQEPWYLGVKTEKLRRLHAETTPEVFKKRNVIGGDRILSRA